MFVPCQYREPGGMWMVDLMRRNPLALLTTGGPADAAPFATHLPVIRDPAAPEATDGDLSGTLLLGHMNRKNPHWSALRTGTEALLVFTGPHGYVSPTVYDRTPAAPTWNFTAVHVRGTIEMIPSVEETLEVVTSTVRDFESGLGTGWDMSESLEYFRRIVPGVGAFRMRVTTAEGMFKLSQEQEPDVREKVRQSFAEQHCGRHRETADLMGRLP